MICYGSVSFFLVQFWDRPRSQHLRIELGVSASASALVS